MSHESHNPTDRLSAWGKAQHQTPSRNLEMKNVALFSLKPVEKKFKFRPFRWVGYSLATIVGAYYFVFLPVVIFKMKMDERPSKQMVKVEPVVTKETSLAKSADTFGLNPFNTELQGALGSADLGTTIQRLTIIPSLGKFVAEQVFDQEKGYYDDVSDTREFLKTYYQATIRTRNVTTLATRIQTIARGYGGRMDDISVNKESAHISFVVPKNKFDAFTEEMRGLVHPKFIEENISAKNLLSQKQVIEKQTNRAEETLFTVQQQRDILVKNHQSLVNNLQNQINSFNRQIRGLRNQYATTTSTAQQQILSNQVALVTQQQNQAKQVLAQENSRYETALRLNDVNVSASQDRVDNWYKEDSELLANVETVEASVSLRWISVWEVIELYVPIYGLAAAVLLGGVATYWVVYLVRPQKFPE